MQINEMRTFLGKRVKVTLDTGEYSTSGNPVITTGLLLAFGDGGNFEILGEDGFVHYCWPLLDMEEIVDE